MTSSACKETPAFDVRASIVNNLVFVETKVNDASPSLFLLDTAAATSVIDKAIAEGIGLSGSGGPLDLSTGGGSVEGSKLSKVELRIGDNVRVSDSNVVALDLRSLGEGLGVPVGGILGFEVFRKYVVAIDYDDQRVTFQHPDDYRPGSDAQMLAVHLEDNIPFIDVKRAEQWSGMSLAAQGAGFRAYHVRSVVVGSPADDAGILAGDVLVAVNEQPATAFTLGELRRLFREPDRDHVLEMTRKGVLRQVRFHTRRLV